MDNIANMLTAIRHAKSVNHANVKVAYSKVNMGIAQIFKSEGFIEDVQVKDRGGKQRLIISLKYSKDGESVINNLTMVSKPGKRIYASYKEIPKVRYGYGILVVSTPQGIMTGENAKKEKVGGEVLCKVW